VPAETAERAVLRLNLGDVDPLFAGYINIGAVPAPGLEGVDLSRPWPWEDSSVVQIRAWDLIQRLPDKILTMNELWRVLKPDAIVEIAVPTTDGPGAFQDPGNVSYWNRRSFLYYEAGDPYRERFASRYGIRAHFRTRREQISVTPEGPRLTIALQAVKPSAGEAEARLQPTIGAEEPVRFLGAMRIKDEARHLSEVLERALAFCERVYVFDDHSTDQSDAICRSFGTRVRVFPSPFEGLDEARDKNYLLDEIVRANPEWVFWIDGDEVLERRGPQRLRLAADNAGLTAAFSLQISYLWEDEQHIRVDGIYRNFTRPSFFRLRGQSLSQLRFWPTGRGGNFHCGNVPRGLVGEVRPLKVRLKHYGYMTAEQRRAKYEWYITQDPNNALEDNYRHIAGIPGARYAPGPPRIIAWVE
jgi:hypothetical protein